MKNNLFQQVCIALVASLLGSTCAFAVSPNLSAVIKKYNIDSVVVKKDHNLYLTNALGEVTQLTYDGIPKSWPLFSKDGTEIAYVENSDRAGALAMIIVINQRGQELDRVYVHPKEPVGEQAADYDLGSMRYLQSVQWLTDSRIAVSGGINPSTSEVLVYNLPARGVPEQFDDDIGGHGVFSPDGMHYAYETGMPHFTPEADWEPELKVDNNVIFPSAPDAHIRFISSPQWSPNSQSLAILVRNLQTQIVKLVIYNPNRSVTQAIQEIPLPGMATNALIPNSIGDNQATVFYGQGGWVVASKAGAWQLSSDGKSFLPIHSSELVDPAVAARVLRSQLKRAASDSGAIFADFWCKSCSLSVLPRRTHDGD